MTLTMNYTDAKWTAKKAIYCHFDNTDADFFKIASTGTRSLALFYYWYIRMEKASFVFIDEFDAFYISNYPSRCKDI